MLSLENFKKAQAFFQEHHKRLLKEYEGKYIAILQDQVVDADENFSALAERVYTRYGYGPIYMPRVERKAIKVSIPSLPVCPTLSRRQCHPMPLVSATRRAAIAVCARQKLA
jgi:hypothetical protein